MDLVPSSLFYLTFEVMPRCLLDLSKSCCQQSSRPQCCIMYCCRCCYYATSTHLGIHYQKLDPAYSCHREFSQLREPIIRDFRRIMMLLAKVKRLFLELLMRNILMDRCYHFWQSSSCCSFHFGLHTLNGHFCSNSVIEQECWLSRFLNNYSFLACIYLFIFLIIKTNNNDNYRAKHLDRACHQRARHPAQVTSPFINLSTDSTQLVSSTHRPANNAATIQ